MAMGNTDSGSLDPAQFPELNRRFFDVQRSPAQYLEQRVRGLLLSASSDDRVFAVLRDGAELGMLRLKLNDSPELTPDDERLRYATLEAVVLFHHAAETVLRLILALQHRPPCPWIDVTKLRGFGAFRSGVEAFANDLREAEGQERLSEFFYGRLPGTPLPPTVAEADWEDGLAGLTQLLEIAIERVLNEDRLYNSAKHGLTAVGTKFGFTVGNPDGGLPAFEVPPANYLAILEMPNKKHGPKQWTETIHGVQPELTVVLTRYLIEQIDNLWTVARARYLGINDGAIKPIAASTLHQILEADAKGQPGSPGIQLKTFSMALRYLDPGA